MIRGIPFIFIALYATASAFLFAFWTKHAREHVKKFYKYHLKKIPFLKEFMKDESNVHHGFGGIMDDDEFEKLRKQRLTRAHHSEGMIKHE